MTFLELLLKLRTKKLKFTEDAHFTCDFVIAFPCCGALEIVSVTINT